MPFRRMRRQLATKSFEKHSDTKIHVIGPGTVGVPFQIIRETQQGARSEAGAEDTIQLGRSNSEECQQGDTCKFVNIIIQAAPRDTATTIQAGWVEWAFCLMKESDLAPTKTNLGTNTLGDVMTKYLRNQCIMSGILPTGQFTAAVQNIALKIPRKWQTMTTGDIWKVFLNVRTADTTETSTDSLKVLSSYFYKNYH